jgi:hypothetical protein
MTLRSPRIDWPALGAALGPAVLFTLLMSSPFLWGAGFHLGLVGLAFGVLLGLYLYIRRDHYSDPGPDADEHRFPH